MATYQTHAIILKKTDQGEADQLFNIYTEEKGKVIAVGKGAKKIKSKLNSHLQLFAIVNLMIASGKNYDHIAGASLFKNFSKIKNDLKKIVLASFGVELVEKFTKVGHSDPEIFILLMKFFEVINERELSKKNWQVIKQAFVIKLLTLSGFGPTNDIIFSPEKLDDFLKQHLDSELQTEKFLVRLR